MLKIAREAEILMNALPQEVLDSIQFEMVIFSGLSLVEIGQSEPSMQQLKKHMERTMKEYMRLLREAKIKLDKERGYQ